MASLTDRNLAMSMNALIERDEAKAALVEAEDTVIDKLERDIDEMVVTYVSTHGPMATSCRLALAASKISESLENIADQSTNVARRARGLCSMPEVKAQMDMTHMGTLALGMMRESINAFVEVEPDKCPEIFLRDKKLDAINRSHEATLNQVMTENPDLIPACVNLLLVSRSLERVGDYAKNICKDVYFLYTANNIKDVIAVQKASQKKAA